MSLRLHKEPPSDERSDEQKQRDFETENGPIQQIMVKHVTDFGFTDLQNRHWECSDTTAIEGPNGIRRAFVLGRIKVKDPQSGALRRPRSGESANLFLVEDSGKVWEQIGQGISMRIQDKTREQTDDVINRAKKAA